MLDTLNNEVNSASAWMNLYVEDPEPVPAADPVEDAHAAHVEARAKWDRAFDRGEITWINDMPVRVRAR
mgnify:CR=1 FL=1